MALASRTLRIPSHPTVIAGPGVAASLAEEVSALGHRRAFLFVDPAVAASGALAATTDGLKAAGITWALFEEIDPNPTDRNVDAGIAALEAFDADVVVLVGGGSTMDCGKYVALAAANGASGTELAFHLGLDGQDMIDLTTFASPRPVTRDGLPTIAIPTTAGTASETNGGGLITDTAKGRKLTFGHDSVRPKVVLLDPSMTLGLPPGPTATSGMDALTHAIECLCSTGATPYADGLALQAIRMVGRWLPVVVSDPSDVEARAQMQLASHLAGMAFSSGPLLGLVHALGHPLSARLGQPHGQTLASMLPHVMRFNAEVVPAQLALVAEALGVGTDPEAAVIAVEELSVRVGTHRSLGELGADPAMVPTLAEDALADLMILTTPRYPSRAEIQDLYLAAL
jgi:alcohol dehydrogenase